jgi:hypothetical protein
MLSKLQQRVADSHSTVIPKRNRAFVVERLLVGRREFMGGHSDLP